MVVYFLHDIGVSFCSRIKITTWYSTDESELTLAWLAVTVFYQNWLIDWWLILVLHFMLVSCKQIEPQEGTRMNSHWYKSHSSTNAPLVLVVVLHKTKFEYFKFKKFGLNLNLFLFQRVQRSVKWVLKQKIRFEKMYRTLWQRKVNPQQDSTIIIECHVKISKVHGVLAY